MDSFYGGKQGVDFVLRGSFTSVEEMITAFKGGSNYTDIWYGEYCIIDTPNKNDEDNGKVYRRGLDYQNNMGGAIFIAQIVGPSSGTPYFQMLSVDDVKKISKEQLEDYEYRRYPYDYDEENEQFLTTESGQEIGVFEFNKDYDETLIPGKYVEDGETKYNDSILYTWCNVRKDNADADSWFYVGWQQPYLVTDYSIHVTSPYDEDGNIQEDATEIERIDDNSHPFYEHWDLGLPKGIKGDTLRNLKVIVPTAENRNTIYATSAITVNPTTGETTVGAAGYAGIDDDIAAGRQIIVFEYYVYDKVINPDPILIYLGDFNIITDIQVADDGTLTVKYTHDDDSVFTKKIRWVNNVELTEGNGPQGGKFTFTFNNDNPEETKTFDVSWIKGIEIEGDGSVVYTYAGVPETLPDEANQTAVNSGIYRVEDFLQWISSADMNPDTGVFTIRNNRNEVILNETLDWIKDIDFTEDGTVILHHTAGNAQDSLTNLIKWIDNVSLNAATGEFVVDYNYGDNLEVQLDWIDDVYIDESNGNIYIHHTDAAQNVDGEHGELLDSKLKLITGANIAANGTITFTTNTGETITLGNAGGSGSFQLKYIEDVRLQTGINDSKRVQIKYNTEDDYTAIGNPLNYIADMVVRESDWHLLVLYSEPTMRSDGSNLTDNTDPNGIKWYNSITGSDGTQYGASVYWRDMGAIKDQSGILVGFNLDYTLVQDAGFDASIAGTAYGEDGTTGTGVCGYLQQTFPNGLTGDNSNEDYGPATKDKIVTYTTPPTGENLDKQDKEFYAYDYHAYQWYYLGKIADSGMRDAVLLRNDASATDLGELNNKGLFFQYFATTISDNAMPKYWDINYVSV